MARRAPARGSRGGGGRAQRRRGGGGDHRGARSRSPSRRRARRQARDHAHRPGDRPAQDARGEDPRRRARRAADPPRRQGRPRRLGGARRRPAAHDRARAAPALPGRGRRPPRDRCRSRPGRPRSAARPSVETLDGPVRVKIPRRLLLGPQDPAARQGPAPGRRRARRPLRRDPHRGAATPCPTRERELFEELAEASSFQPRDPSRQATERGTDHGHEPADPEIPGGARRPPRPRRSATATRRSTASTCCWRCSSSRRGWCRACSSAWRSRSRRCAPRSSASSSAGPSVSGPGVEAGQDLRHPAPAAGSSCAPRTRPSASRTSTSRSSTCCSPCSTTAPRRRPASVLRQLGVDPRPLPRRADGGARQPAGDQRQARGRLRGAREVRRRPGRAGARAASSTR